MTLTFSDAPTPPAGNPGRFGGRWRLIAAGVSNVWRYGDLDLDAASGRLLLRGPNGTGKTTALEILWPYLLDLNPALLGAGKARNTHLSQLMREGAEGRRVGYVWLTFAAPGDDGVVTYGARLTFSQNATPPVKVTPFRVAARPLHGFALWGPGRSTPSTEQFGEAVTAAGGTAFADVDDYLRDLAGRVFATDPGALAELARRIREVRNPALLAAVSPAAAAEALKVALPTVADDVVEATGDALAESAATRAAFENDRAAAETLEAFAKVWVGHVVDIVDTYRARAETAAGELRSRRRDLTKREQADADARAEAARTMRSYEAFRDQRKDATGRLAALERSDDYRTAGRLAELAARADSLHATADARRKTLVGLADRARSQTASDRQAAQYLAEDLAAAFAAAAKHTTLKEPRVLRVGERPRTPLAVSEHSTDAGPALDVAVDTDTLDGTVAALRSDAADRARRGDAARLYSNAHGLVAAAQGVANTARTKASTLTEEADTAAKTAKATTEAAEDEAVSLTERLVDWRTACPAEPGWGADDLNELGDAEPAGVLAVADSLANVTLSWAHGQAAAASARAKAHRDEAAAKRSEAAGMRAEATRLRDEDVLLPLPRPSWAGAGDDTVAFGSAIDWADGVDATVQDTVEAVLAAAGVLGATLDDAGAHTEAWSVNAAGQPVPSNLAGLLRPDPEHPRAGAAAAVLARIELDATAADASGTRLTIGLDGTYRAGVSFAAVPAAADAALRQPATLIGVRRRRQAALAHAQHLDDQASGLGAAAADLESHAAAAAADAERVLALGASFPRRDALRHSEAARAGAAAAAHRAGTAAAAAERVADDATERAADAQRRWAADVTGAGLPADVGHLTAIAESAKSAVAALRRAADTLDTTLRSRLAALATDVAAHDVAGDLATAHAAAIAAADDATEARAACDELQAALGASPEAILARHRALTDAVRDLRGDEEAADGQYRSAASVVAAAEARLEAARQLIVDAEPAATAAMADLRRLLGLAGVAQAVLDADPDGDDHALLAQVAAAAAGRRRSARRTLRERADDTRARLAGVWALDPGVDHPELDTHLLTHGSATFTPVDAAAHARLLADRAEEALRAADETALQDFVIGRLPQAISTARASLRDWVSEVNKKMKSASASSGVGIAVRVSPRPDDLSPVARTVYELVCNTGEALRDPAAKKDAGRAIQQLISAAEGDDMVARVAAAVDVRAWVDVIYLITRPGEDPRPWNSRTGLSGGERRLVVLAPMLAAVAAAYDRLGQGAGRLVALDEIPSEVDEEGREGLARYIAALDLDFIATSHHWDGAPGAWDGIDAHDLEAAPDGTVVAFPMLVRAAAPLPDDPMLQ
jgi:hypothetical protein